MHEVPGFRTRGMQKDWAGRWIGFGPAVAGVHAFKMLYLPPTPQKTESKNEAEHPNKTPSRTVAQTLKLKAFRNPQASIGAFIITYIILVVLIITIV